MSRADHNRETIELWLVTRAMKLSTRPPAHPDEHHGRTGKPQSTPGQSLSWIEAIDTAEARDTDTFLTRVIDKELPREDRAAYATMWLVYLAPSADEALPEYWRRNPSWTNKKLGKLLERAFAYVMKRARKENRVLYWPEPEGSKTFTDEQRKKRRIARYTYFQARREGDKPSVARRKAIHESRASRSAVYFWTREGARKKAKEEAKSA